MKSTKTKPRKRKLNVRLIRKIQKHILEEPRRFVMWAIKLFGKPGELHEGDGPIGDSQEYPACGTAQCIAGWALTLSGHPRSRDVYKATKLLGFGRYREDVFDQPSWPEPFRSRYDGANTQKARAQIASERLEHLITTGK